MKIKIKSNPYDRTIFFTAKNDDAIRWESIMVNNPNSKLREFESIRKDETLEDSIENSKTFLPFKIKEIIDSIVEEYYVGNEPVQVVFEGTDDEKSEIKSICDEACYDGKVELSNDGVEETLCNARYIFKDIKEIFQDVLPIIEKVNRKDDLVMDDLDKVKGALEDYVPICVFGNYSAGKSTFINALIGCEILPSGGDPVTAKVYQIVNSDQPDKAVITFEYLNIKIKLIFEGNNYKVDTEAPSSDLLEDINKKVAECDTDDMFSKIRVALEIINDYERKDKDVIVISDVIDIRIPFSTNGILGQSHNNFIVFDTPGSNSASNQNHSRVLAKALDRFSNGIPVWVSQYESIDSEDNSALCEKIMQIKALDERFTMIIMNKADVSDLPEKGFSDKEVLEILDFKAVEKMYSSGIYFVSSIMGLGAKKEGALTDKHYRKIFRTQRGMYEDPDDEDYATLYNYNIMPKSGKNRIVDMSRKCPDLIYANSGLYGIETTMEIFASKYAAYNKCQMVYVFLQNVIDNTQKRIDNKTKAIAERKAESEKKLENEKIEILKKIKRESQDEVDRIVSRTQRELVEYVEKELHFEYGYQKLEELEQRVRDEFAQDNHLDGRTQDLEDNKTNMWSHFKVNGQSIFKGNVLSNVKDIASELYKDYRDVQNSREVMESTEKEVDKATSDVIIHNVVSDYKKNVANANDELNRILSEKWYANAQELRNKLVNLIAKTESLTEMQRDDISQIIIDYKPLVLEDKSASKFDKKRFLKGMLFGIKINDSEKINLKMLDTKYNKWINDNVEEIADDMNKSFFSSFEVWRKGLGVAIENNIDKLNPELRNLSDLIAEDEEQIAEYSEYKDKIGKAFNDIGKMMDWIKVY